MKQNLLSQDLNNLIATGKEDKAIEALLLLESENNETINKIILLSNQLKNIKRRESLNLPFKLEDKNRIIFSIIKIVAELEKSGELNLLSPSTSYINKYKLKKRNVRFALTISIGSFILISFFLELNIIGLLIILILIAILAINSFGEE